MDHLLLLEKSTGKTEVWQIHILHQYSLKHQSAASFKVTHISTQEVVFLFFYFLQIVID